MAYVFGTSKKDTLFGYHTTADVIFGYAGDDLLFGLGGNDLLFGHQGNDGLFGGTGDDGLFGGDGDDVLSGGAGADQIFGGAGIDTAEYLNSGTGVIVSLVAGAGFLGDAQGDMLSGVENVIGSNFNDTLLGDNNANRLEGRMGDDTLFGNGGSDVLIGGAGGDVLDGGAGVDLASYAGSSSGVWVFLQAGSGHFGDAQGDSLHNIEDLAGSDHDDTLFGDNAGNAIYGGEGNDSIFGAGGNDTLLGDGGNDIIGGGDGEDLIFGDTGYDQMTGGGDADRFVFAASEASPGFGPILNFAQPLPFGRIEDFDSGEGDKIQILGTGLSFIGDYLFTGQAGEIRYQNISPAETWIEGDLDGDGVANFRIELAGEHELTQADLIL